MNKTPFKIQKTESKQWAVYWFTFKNIKEVDSKLKLLNIVFGQMNCNEVGLAVLLQDGEYDTLWLNYKVWAQNSELNYADYVMDMYEIRGVVFHTQAEAKQFQDILEKKYIWKVLQA